jgi:oligopeptide/dipeptide ABC transporter ATP-binding protein
VTTNPDLAAPLLAIRDLVVSFEALRGRVRVLDGVGLDVWPGEVLGLVGESGSGKSVTALSILGLLGEQGRVDAGQIVFQSRDLTRLPERELLKIRGREIAMIFQEPMTSLNPVFSVGFQVAEVLVEHLGLDRRRARARAVELLGQVGIPDPDRRVDTYPHQLSGGMRQRAMIAMAMACRPRLLLADEPTTALDVTIQAQILDLVRRLRVEQGTAVLLISHDLGVIAGTADRVLVMYAGEVVEAAPARELFSTPLHPYTRLLLRSIPRVHARVTRLRAIPGTAPSPLAWPPGCRFHPRCPDAIDRCRVGPLPLTPMGEGRSVRCLRAGEPGLPSAADH